MSNIFSERFYAKRPNTSPLSAPDPDDSFSYLVGRAVSVFPTCNGNQAAFLAEDFRETRGLKQLIGTDKGFKFGLANANHSVGPGKSNMVLGSIRDEEWAGDGVDLVVQIDKRACEAYSVEPEDFTEEGGLNSFSIEIACDRDRSTFVAMTNPASQKLEDQTIFSAEEAAQQGIRRTSFAEPNPFLYQDKFMVVELCSPIRCRGVAVLPDPADKTANVYEVAASMEKPKSLRDQLKAAKGEEHTKRVKAVKDTLNEHGIKLSDDQDHALDRALGISEGGKLDTLIDSITGADEEAAQIKEPYGDVDYADPGYRDGKKRYPIDEKHIRAALSFWGNPENREEYTPEQQKHITDKIDAAKKKFGIGDEEDSGFSVTDTPYINSVGTDYDGCDAIDIDAAQSPDMPDEAFADTYFNPEEVSDERKYPLYASPADYVKGKPHKGLVKAALQAHADGKIQNRKSALQRLQVAHSLLHGAKPMNDTEQAALEAKVAEVQAALAGKDTMISEKDTEIAGLKEQNTKLAEEIAALKAKEDARTQEELANKRLAELTAIEGFAVKDEEKASLVEALKTEDQIGFENRVLKAKIASMEEAAKKVKESKKGDEEDASLIVAAARGDLDIFPSGAGKDDKKADIYSIM